MGPAGPLEATLDQAVNEKTITAILCHPHPAYGGSMHDAVVNTATQVFLRHGVNCIRFNFRGVGASAGTYGDGVGETEDLLAVVNWQQQEYPRDKLWLCGYSFGANVVWRSLATAAPARAFLIAPPISMMEFAEQDGTDTVINAIAGDRDDFVDQDRIGQWPGVTHHNIPGADHFFSGAHDALGETLEALVRQPGQTITEPVSAS